MADSAQKMEFLRRAQNIANQMATLDAAIKDAGSVLANQGWIAGGSDPIIAEDIPADAGFTVAEALAFFSTAAKFNTFMNGGALNADATVRATIDRMRSSYSL